MRLAQYISGSGAFWGNVNLETIKRGLGGRETAAVNLARCWADMGHEVYVFAKNDDPTTYTAIHGGQAHFLSVELAKPLLSSLDFNACLSWEAPQLFEDKAIRERCAAMVCGMQVAHVYGSDALGLPDSWVALSPWHAQFLRQQLPPQSFIDVMPNGIDVRRFPLAERAHPLIPEFVYSSSPDRGLHHLLRIWPRIRERYPEAILNVAYGAKRWIDDMRYLHNVAGELAVLIDHGLKQPGVNDLGRIGQDQLARLLLRSTALLYPCDTLAPTETGCITIIEAMAAGLPVVTTDCDCLGSEFGGLCRIVPLPFEDDAYLTAVFEVMEAYAEYEALAERAHHFAWTRSWESIAPNWIALFQELAQATRRGRAA